MKKLKTKPISSSIVGLKVSNLVWSIFVCMLMLGCNEDHELLEPTLEGTWVEVEPADLNQYEGDNHTFLFDEEGFLLKLRSWTDIMTKDENGNWRELEQTNYGKGIYFINAHTITINGVLGLDSDYSEPDDASKLEPFQRSFTYRVNSKNTIVLNPQSEFESITLVKE